MRHHFTPFSVSLIISTYNRADALALIFESILQQVELPDEVIIADDGSTDATRQVITAYQQKLTVPINHCWHEDQGFRLAAIRNKAIAKAQHAYIILIDGDIVMHRLFIYDHKQAAQSGTFLQGTRVLLGKEVTETAISTLQTTFSIFSNQIKNRINMLRFPLLRKIFVGYQHPLKGIRSCNSSFWRQDAINVNGFNEAFGSWGREDSEFAARLQHNGIKRINLKFSALAYHLHHPVTQNNLSDNDTLLATTLQQKRTWCDVGIQQYL